MPNIAIIIQNISRNTSPFGEHEYEVRINQEVVTSFTHKREEGLAICLRRAAAAVERSKWMETTKFMAGLDAEIKMVEEEIAKVKKSENLNKQYIILAACSGFLLGFGLCLLWYGAQVSAIHDTLAAWRAQYEQDYRNHHNMKPVSKAAAQVIVQKAEDARRME